MNALSHANEYPTALGLVFSLARKRLFLAALLDTLAAGVEGSLLAASLGRKLLAGLLVCCRGMSVNDLLAAHFVGFGGGLVPARFFSRKALSSSSRSFWAFLACFKGLTLPPVMIRRGQLCDLGGVEERDLEETTDLLG